MNNLVHLWLPSPHQLRCLHFYCTLVYVRNLGLVPVNENMTYIQRPVLWLSLHGMDFSGKIPQDLTLCVCALPCTVLWKGKYKHAASAAGDNCCPSWWEKVASIMRVVNHMSALLVFLAGQMSKWDLRNTTISCVHCCKVCSRWLNRRAFRIDTTNRARKTAKNKK